MKTTVKQSCIHSLKGLTYPCVADNYLKLFVGTIFSYLIFPEFLLPVWLFLISVFSMITLDMERNNAHFDDTVLKFTDKNGFKKFLKTSMIWSLILSFFTSIDLDYDGFISTIFVFTLVGLYILYMFGFMSKNKESNVKVKELDDNWLLFIGITTIFVFLSTWLYTPILFACYVLAMYSMSFEKIEKKK